MKYLLSFLMGAAAGAAVALMLAPSSGEELRANIKTQADTQYARLQDEWQHGMDQMQTRMDRLNDDMHTLTEHLKEGREKA